MKKAAFYGALVLTIISYCALASFAFAQTSENKSVQEVNFEGAWRVVTYVNADMITMIDNEYMVFGNDTATDYREDTIKAFVESKYTFDEGRLLMNDIGKEYTVDAVSENVLCLYDSPTVHTALIRLPDEKLEQKALEKNAIIGSWRVVYRPGIESLASEELVFDETNLSDYRNGDSNPALVAPYRWNDGGNLVIDRIAKVFRLIPIDNDTICFIEMDTGYVWELQRIK